MNNLHLIEHKRYLTFPPPEPPSGRARRAVRHLAGAVALPVVLGASWLYGGQGLASRLSCMRLGLRTLRAGHRKMALGLLAFPMDSFRYFELAYVRDKAAGLSPDRYLDVSSPRLVPLMLLDERRGLTGDLINPIVSDLRETEEMAAGLGLAGRCRTGSVLLEDAAFADRTFNLITSVSVVEHIPDDTAAIATMWRLLKPGGTMLITVPCARRASEEYTNLDEYGLFATSNDGFVYWQRYYDAAALAARIWSVTGTPDHMVIFGEKAPGSYDRNVMRKRVSADYPYWYEPLMMAREYRVFASLDELPGMGVVGMTFTKPVLPADH